MHVAKTYQRDSKVVFFDTAFVLGQIHKRVAVYLFWFSGLAGDASAVKDMPSS